MGRTNAQIARLEKMVSGQPATREVYVTFAPTEFLEAAKEAAESETGVPILEIDPFSLKASTWRELTIAMLKAGFGIRG